MPIELELEKMTLAEKLHAMEVRWADLSQREENVRVPQWHKDVLDERERQIRDGKTHFMDWQAAKKLIAERIQ